MQLNSKQKVTPVRNYLSLVALTVFFILPGSFCCRESTAPPVTIPLPQMSLTAEYATAGEAWLQLRLADARQAETIELYCNDSLRFAFTTAEDTLLYDDRLLPGQTYSYRARLLRNGNVMDSTETAAVSTLDSTAFDYSTRVFYFGERSQSLFNDVFILSPDNIWAVGEINTQETDSLGYWVDAYNAVHWDGNDWELKRIEYSYGGYLNPIIPIRGIWAFHDRNIWFVSGSIMHFDGDSTIISFLRNTDTPEIAGKIWAYDSTMVVSVGTEGLAVYYDGSQWRRITTNSKESINDVWGCVDPQSGERTILASGTHAVFDLSSLRDATCWDWPDPGPSLNSIWFGSKYSILAVGDGIFRHALGDQWREMDDISPFYVSHINGNDYNDLFVCGHFGLLAKFNGCRWHVYENVPDANYRTLSCQNDLMVTAGDYGNQAVIVMMERN